MSNIFRPFTARNLEKYLADIRKRFDALPEPERAGFINPDEPVVLTVPNPEYEEPPSGCDEKEDDDNWVDASDKYLHFHICSVGGGGDVDEDGNECGHDGFSISGMEIDYNEFLYNGRRIKKKDM